MSAFLGKIHFWLYNKIQLHEELINKIIELATSKGYKSDELVKESYLKYGEPAEGPLENQIDHNNIHGWLQDRITSVELRLAFIVTNLTNNNIIKDKEIEKVFYENGVNTMKKLGLTQVSIDDFYNLIFDYMLEGMPCDRINEILNKDENCITWKLKRNIHKDYWDKVSGDINYFNDLRVAWINGFASETDYKYSITDKGIHILEKR
ncbi:MAG: hypothetical protein GX275_12980 [Clostridiales bacterium]|nr:hypothetical protein [Clostridiales bacterium]